MKNWIRCIVLSLLLIAAAPMVVAAASGSGIFTVEGNDVALTLQLPEGKTESITSLRFQLHISAVLGTIDAPKFQFEDSVKSWIKDADIRQSEDGSYLADIILSGKKDQDIFSGSEYAKIGTLSLNPTSKEYQIKIEFAPYTEDSKQPAAKYMDGSGLDEMQLQLDGSIEVSNPKSTEIKPPTEQTDSEQTLLSKPKLKTSVTKGSKSVIFQWKKIKEADGYEIYRYDSKTETYQKIKTIQSSKTTACSKKFSYASSHIFLMRAFKIKQDGSTGYSEYSSAVKTTLPPAKVKKVSIKNKSKNKPTLSWKKTAKAKGYQIYRSKDKNGTYKLLKTIKKGKTTKWTVNKPKSGTVYYYKVRAYVTGPKGKRIYGNFSVAKSLK